MQFRFILTLAAAVTLAMVSIAEATTSADVKFAAASSALQPDKTKPMGRFLEGHTAEPEKTKPMGRFLQNHSPAPEKTKPMGRLAQVEHPFKPDQTIPAGIRRALALRGGIA